MVNVLKISFFVLLCVIYSFSDKCVHTQAGNVPINEHCPDRTPDYANLNAFTGISKETKKVYFNDHTVETSSETITSQDIIESIGNSEVYEDPHTTTEYEGEGYVTHSSHYGDEGKRIYEEQSSEMGEVLESGHKITNGAITDQLENKNDSVITPSENKTDVLEESLKTQSLSSPDIKNLNKNPGAFPSDVHVDDFMKSRIAFSLDAEKDIFPEKLTMGEDMGEEILAYNEKKPMSSSSPEILTMEETFGDFIGNKHEENTKDSLPNSNIKQTSDPVPQGYSLPHRSIPMKLISDTESNSEFNVATNLETSTEKTNQSLNEEVQQNQNIKLIPNANTMYTTDTTLGTTITHEKKGYSDIIDYFDEGTELPKLEITSQPLKDQTVKDFDEKSVKITNSEISNEPLIEEMPKAERLYSFREHNDLKEDNASLNDHNVLDITMNTSIPEPLRDYEDKSEEDKIVIKGLLNDYQMFKKEKIEPSVLFEDCPDCDLRLLPIRPSEQRSTPKLEVEHLPSPKIRFSDLPEGRELQMNNLGLSDGVFLFSYLSEFLSCIQPNDFPVDLLRQALKSQISWAGLIFESLQVEAGFVACLVAVVLLALAVPMVVLSHACYRMGARDQDQDEAPGWAGNCRRRTLVFILQLLLILLFGGMVAMFATNEQLSGAVIESSDVLQASLGDVSSFIHNAHLQLHFLITQSLDQALQAIYADLDNVDSLLGRPIQQELVRETGLDVALDSLGDLTREAKETTQQVERFLDEARIVQEMLVSSREKLSDLRQQVELFRRACGPRDRSLCDTIDSSGLDITLRLDRIKSDERLNRMRRMGGVGLEAAAVEAKEHFLSVPGRVEADTRDSREAVRRQLSRQRAEVDDNSRGLEQFARDISSKVNNVKYEAGFWMQDIDQFEYWRWIVCMGGGAAVLMIWSMLLSSMCCGCCGSEKAAGPTILVTIVVVCLFSTVLWSMVLVGLLVGGHGEVFVCRPLYDDPEYHVITDLVDQPGVFYNEARGGFISNVLYGNDSLDVPIKQILHDCRDNRAIYPTLGLHRIFDVEAAVDQHRWSTVSAHLRAVRANLSNLEVLSPVLQDQLSDLLATLSVNFTEHRIQMSKPVTGKDLDSFARQLDNIGNQMRDLATASRMETLSSRTRRLIDSYIRPLEGKKDALVYQLTALEVQTGPLQRQVNQSLSHLKTIQFFINSQGESIAHRKSREYVDRLVSYVDQLRHHVIDSVMTSVSPCRPLWDIFNNTRLFLCRHTMDPLNGYWFATMWCLLVLLVATPVCLKLVDYYRAQGSRSSGSPTENLMISEQGTGWSTPGYDIKCSKEHDSCDIK